MSAQDRYFRELVVVVSMMELLSLYRQGVAVSSFAWSESSLVYLVPLFLVGSRSTKPLSQLSPSRLLHAQPSVVVESGQLVGK
jgi:hypothetical protein